MTQESDNQDDWNQIDLDFFYLNPTFSDLTIRIANEEICVHKIVLSSRSGYFREILLKEEDLTVLPLEDVNSLHFKELLKIIYSHVREIPADLTDLADRFKLELNEEIVIENLEKFSIENCCDLLNRALLSESPSLKANVLQFMNENATQLIDENHLVKLSQESAVCFLSQDELSFDEMKIFEAIEKWRKHNHDRNDLVARCLRLSRFTRKELITSVGRCEFIDKIQLLQVLEEIENNSLKVQKRKGDSEDEEVGTESTETNEVWDQNLATKEFGINILYGKNTTELFNSNFCSAPKSKHWPHHKKGDPNGITIEWGCPLVFNHIKFRLIAGSVYCSYYIEISEDNTNWKRIIDYSQFYCKSLQNLYFEKVSAQYIRFVGVEDIYMAGVEVMLKSETPQFKNGFIRPIENVATKDKGATVISFQDGDKLLDGDTRQTEDNWIGHEINKTWITIHFAQPVLVSCFKLLLFGEYKYRYFIEVCKAFKDWQVLVDRRDEDCSGWQELHFAEQPISFINITGTYSSNKNWFKCVHFECSAQENT